MVESVGNRRRDGELISPLIRPRDVPLQLVIAAGLVYLAVRSIEFLLQAGYPPGYFFDLGVHILATSYQAATIKSFADLLDCVGYAAWADVPQYLYNPMSTSVALVSIAKLGVSSQLAIKVLTVAQIWLSLVSMSVLYRTIRRSTSWALFAGLTYALLPAISLQISSNFDIGFCVALAPLALAAGFRLIRRFGNAALPLIGAICGFVGQGFSTEYFFVLSIPLYAIVVLYALRARDRLTWLAGSLAGAICSVCIGLYSILPTFAASALLSSPASRIAESEHGGILAVFGESLTALWHGVLTESTTSPFPEFNVTSLLWITSVALTILWVASLAFAVRRIQRGGRLGRQAIFVATLVLLAFGSAVPFAATFWRIVAHVPFIQFLRTPDRLILIPFVYLVWWGVAMLETVARAYRRSSASAKYVAGVPSVLALIIASLCFFDFEAGALIVRPSIDYRLPGLVRTNAAAIRQAKPLVAYTFVNQGSVLNTPLYGDGARTRIIAQDLISRFGTGPGHALGMLRKAGIQTVVTTPVWAVDGPAWPDLGTAFATARWAKSVYGSASEPAIWHIRDSAPDVSATETACFHGGPGTLDELTLVPIVHAAALSLQTRDCAFDVYANADPRDDLRDVAASWPGSDFSKTPARDQDYSFIMTRSLLARPWYRDAVEGDSSDFARASVTVPSPWHGNVSFEAAARATYVARVRLAAPIALCFAVAVDGRTAGTNCANASYGQHWVAVRLALTIGRHRLSFGIHPRIAGPPGASFILDGVVLAHDPDAFRADLPARARIVAYSAEWLADGPGLRAFWVPAGRYRAAWLTSDATPLADRVAIAGGLPAHGGIDIVRSGTYTLTAAAPANAALLAFFDRRLPPAMPQTSIARKQAAATYDVAVTSRSTVRATVLDDRSWSLDGDGRHYGGSDCDLVDTCFEDVTPGKYVLRHRWPLPVRAGLAIFLLTWLVSFVPCIYLAIRPRAPFHLTSRLRHAESER